MTVTPKQKSWSQIAAFGWFLAGFIWLGAALYGENVGLIAIGIMNICIGQLLLSISHQSHPPP